jgi:hypothetical protein
MRLAGKLVLAIFLIALVVFGITQLVMVRFSVESRYSEKFSISPIIGNLFLIKSGLWTKVRQEPLF